MLILRNLRCAKVTIANLMSNNDVKGKNYQRVYIGFQTTRFINQHSSIVLISTLSERFSLEVNYCISLRIIVSKLSMLLFTNIWLALLRRETFIIFDINCCMNTYLRK